MRKTSANFFCLVLGIAAVTTMVGGTTLAAVMVIDGNEPGGGDCPGTWDAQTATCDVPALVVEYGNEVIVRDATVLASLGNSDGVLRVKPGATIEAFSVLVGGSFQHLQGTGLRVGLFENGGNLSSSNNFINFSGTVLNYGSIETTWFVNLGFFVNSGQVSAIDSALGSNTNSDIIANTGLMIFAADFADLQNLGDIYNCGGSIVGEVVTNPPITDVDADNDGVCNGGDCAPGNSMVWNPAGYVADVRLQLTGSTSTIIWSAQPEDGTGGLVYDVIASTDPTEFQISATCLETDDGSDTQAGDTTVPASGDMISYLVRAQGTCGEGPLGQSDVPRMVLSCLP